MFGIATVAAAAAPVTAAALKNLRLEGVLTPLIVFSTYVPLLLIIKIFKHINF